MSPLRATKRQNVIWRRKSNGNIKKIRLQRRPDYKYEKQLIKSGITLIAGVDEVGIGSWAGPLVAAAVIFAPDTRIYKIRDSKILDIQRREELFTVIAKHAEDYAVGVVEVGELNNLGLSKATKLAGERALAGLKTKPEAVLLDGHWNYLIHENVSPIKHGDTLSVTIAAASIIAKVHRDNLMMSLHNQYPQYDFHNNKGYPSPKHKAALSEFGPCEIHRINYAPIKKLLSR